MRRTVAGAGSILLRGLGPSGLLVTRGLGSRVVIDIRPRQLRHRGSGPKPYDGTTIREQVRCYFVGVRLITVNGQNLTEPIGGEVKVCYGRDQFSVTSSLPRVSRRIVDRNVMVRLLRGKD